MVCQREDVLSKHLIDQECECQVDHQRTGENTLIAAEQYKFCTPVSSNPRDPRRMTVRTKMIVSTRGATADAITRPRVNNEQVPER